MRFSASRLTTWESCALQAKFHYVDKLPDPPNAKTVFGTIIHHCLEHYNLTGDVDVCIEMFKDLWLEPERIAPPIAYWPKFTTYGGLHERGVQILREYHEKQKWEDREILATEHAFLVPFGEHELTGYVDLLDIKRSGKGKDILRVEDYKTSSRKPMLSNLVMNIQFTIYIYASLQREFWVGNGDDFPGMPNGEWLFETLADMPRRAIWYHLWGNAELDAGPREEKDFQRLYRLCTEIAKATEHEVYIPTISGDSCGYCPYSEDPCPVSIPSARELAEQEDAWL